MNSENDNFDQIQRMLKLKRYEQPPPRYFNDFSSQIIGRIRAGEVERHAPMNSNARETPWLQRLWSVFTSRPGLAGSFAAAVCAVFIGGLLYSESADTLPAAGLGMTASSPGALAPVNAGAAIPLSPNSDLALLAASSTNPVVQLTSSLFDQIRLNAQPVPVAFQFNGN